MSKDRDDQAHSTDQNQEEQQPPTEDHDQPPAEDSAEEQPEEQSEDQAPQPTPEEPLPALLGERIRTLRQRQKLSLSELARMSDISKGYLSQVERSHATRPSAITIFSIAEALGVSVTALFEGEDRPARTFSAPEERSASLIAFAEQADLPLIDVEMLAAIHYRGEQPKEEEDWRFLYESIRRSVGRTS